MPETSLRLEYSRWSIPDHAIRIEYAPRILAEIELEVLDGFHRLRKGGVEVGGVLFGAREGQAVTIVDFRALTCEHALGPGFVLSDRDRHALGVLLTSPATDPALTGLVPVGWYRSNTRSHIHLSPKDLEFFQEHFPESWQIALVFKPDTFLPTKVGFFFREEDGGIRAESSYREFSLPARIRPDSARKTDCDAPVARAVAIQQRSSIPVIPLSAPQHSEGGRSRWWIAAPTAVIVAILLAWLGTPRTVESPPEPLALTLQERNGQLRISWDQAAKPISEHASGLLEIKEGGESALVDLNRDQLKTGTVTYKRSSGSVNVIMRVGKTEETAVFIGALPETRPSEQKLESADRPPLATETPASTGPDSDTAKVVLDKAKGEETTKQAPAKTLVAHVVIPRRQERAPISLQVPPQIERVAASTLSSPLLGSLPVVPAPPRSPIPAATAARTGALIWTGRLAKNEVLSIHGTRPSTGSLTGALPGQPVRIRAYPAELTSDGISVYSSGQKHPPGHTELPAARNGWNKTSYRSDPRVAEALKILETPGPKNGWNRLMLRHEAGKLSIVLVEWELL